MTEKNPYFGATFAERKAIREAVESKQIDADDPDVKVEDKAVKRTTTRAKKKS